MVRNQYFFVKLVSAIALFFFTPIGVDGAALLFSDTIVDPPQFPGTSRKVEAYAFGNCSTDAALLLCFDGDVFSSRAIVDSLVEARVMPPTVMVCLNPGVVRGDDGEVLRYNRSYEFDALTSAMSDFVATVLLPRVRRLLGSCGINLSPNPDMHAVAGASSGGIAAFTLAWHRPDLFRRVYCSVGTFVAMRGGDGYPAIVRKTDTKPLRIFLHDGRKDAWNPLFGHWFEYNQLMESALRFAGYDVAHAWDDGGHSIRGGIREFPAAMAWLWKDWRKPIIKGRSENDMLRQLTIDGEDWSVALEPVFFPEPSVARTSEGWTFGMHGGPSLAVSPDHRILVEAEPCSDWLVASVIGADGSLSCRQRFYWLHNTVHCADTTVRQMAFDSRGNLFVATNMGIQICDQNGRVRAILPLPAGKPAEAMAIIGDRLYAKSGATVYVRRLDMHGCHPEDRPVKPVSQGQG